MKRLKYLWILFAVLLATACGDDDTLAPGTDDGASGELQAVTFTVSMDYEMTGYGTPGTRAVSATEDDTPTRCLMQVFDTNGNAVDKLQKQEGTDSYKFTVYLVPEQTYTFCFWADNDTQEVTSLQNVPYQQEKVAFAANVSGTPGSVTTDISLTHAVAKVTLKTTSAIPAKSQFTITVPTTYTAYNVKAGTVTDAYTENTEFPHTTTSDISVPSGGEAEVFSFYALVGSGEQQIKLAIGDDEPKTITASLAPNRHTVLKGSAGIKGLEIADDGTSVTYIVSSAEALYEWAKAAQSNTKLNCTLADDITLTGTNNWTPVGTSSNPYIGNFDGAGHTISGLNIQKTSSNGSEDVGFIGYMQLTTVKNLIVANADIRVTSDVAYASLAVGGIVGYCGGGTIQGCGFSGKVSGEATNKEVMCIAYVGGIVGGTNPNVGNLPSIIACWSTATVTASAEVTGAGGIAGYATNTNVKACYYANSDNGLGGFNGSTQNNTTLVDDTNPTWETAAEAMNGELTDYKWKVNEGTDATDVPLVFVKTN